MTILVLGANGSGKSAYAERLAAKLAAGALYYIATMIPYGAEGQARVEKHRKQREYADFVTVERDTDVSGIEFAPNAAALLEDVSNLLSNAMFGCAHGGNVDSVFDDIAAMCESCRNTVLVSIDGLSAAPEYSGETRAYISALNRLNGRLSDFADIVIVMHDATPVCVKGDADALD